MITVILPCAGEGTRLSLPYPKEIHSIEKNKSLIDYSFDLFSNYGRRDVQFIVTLTEDKTDIIRYLSRYKSRFNISFTFFNPKETEYTGSIKSAKHLFGEKNIVLLPDTYLKLKESDDIIDLVGKCEKILPHFHIPLQSGSDKILRLMKRIYMRNVYVP